MLDEKRLALVQLMLQGVTNKTVLKDKIGCSRQSIYDWLNEEEVQAALDKGLTQLQTQVAKKITSQLEPVVDELYDIALHATGTRERKDACIYLINRVLGTPKDTLNVDDNRDENLVDVMATFNRIVAEGNEIDTDSEVE